MIKKSMIIMALACCAIFSHATELTDSELVGELQNTGRKVSSIINEIENEFSANQAMFQLQKLIPQFNRMKAEFENRLKANPMSLIRYSSDIAQTMTELKNALVKFNARDTVPFDLRQKISSMLKH